MTKLLRWARTHWPEEMAMVGDEIEDDQLTRASELWKQSIVRIEEVRGCSRCGGDHEKVTAERMARPFAPPEANGVSWTHWFPCPTNGDPVLVQVTP